MNRYLALLVASALLPIQSQGAKAPLTDQELEAIIKQSEKMNCNSGERKMANDQLTAKIDELSLLRADLTTARQSNDPLRVSLLVKQTGQVVIGLGLAVVAGVGIRNVIKYGDALAGTSKIINGELGATMAQVGGIVALLGAHGEMSTDDEVVIIEEKIDLLLAKIERLQSLLTQCEAP